MPNEMNSPSLTDEFHLAIDNALKLKGLGIIYERGGHSRNGCARIAQAEGMRYIGFRHERSPPVTQRRSPAI
jgi:oxalyl-CoA decarboxylase